MHSHHIHHSFFFTGSKNGRVLALFLGVRTAKKVPTFSKFNKNLILVIHIMVKVNFIRSIIRRQVSHNTIINRYFINNPLLTSDIGSRSFVVVFLPQKFLQNLRSVCYFFAFNRRAFYIFTGIE